MKATLNFVKIVAAVAGMLYVTCAIHGSDMKCVTVPIGCATCESTQEFVIPVRCSPGGPAGLDPGTCNANPGICNSWASYLCGTGIRCDTQQSVGIPCDTAEFCSGAVH